MKLTLFGLLLLNVGLAFAREQTEIPVEYISNYDGDTILVNLPSLKRLDKSGAFSIFWDRIDVRLGGIDTPEMRGKCENEKVLARKAKEWVAAKLHNAREVTLNNVQKDKYFRLLGEILVDGIPLAQMLLDQGLAIPYDGGAKGNPWCPPKTRR